MTPHLITLDARGQFTRDNRPFVANGINSYPLLELLGHGKNDAVDSIFSQAKYLGRNIIRTNAFFEGSIGTPPHPAELRNAYGVIQEPGLRLLDALVARAREHGVHLLLTLANHWSDYGGAPAVISQVYQHTDLPIERFYDDQLVIEAQKTFVHRIASRTNTRSGVYYATDPTIFAWELVNEPRYSRGLFGPRNALLVWAQQILDTLREAGAKQLVSWGGVGYFDRFGENAEAIARDTDIDILTLHMYPKTQMRPHDSRAALAAARETIAAGLTRIGVFCDRLMRYRKGLIVEEVGWQAGFANNVDAQRGLVFDAWQKAARERHMGFFPWMIAEPGRQDFDGYLIRQGDEATRRVLTA